ncbi:MAG TPA: hypothetical protein VEQ66_13295 [Propionibacteriaceae bacterium]|nr:hypothetical protein [Propionibacteriaceae bacterium]
MLFEATRYAALVTGNPRLLPAMVLFGTLVVPIAFLTLVWGCRDSHDVSPVTTVIVASMDACL